MKKGSRCSDVTGRGQSRFIWIIMTLTGVCPSMTAVLFGKSLSLMAFRLGSAGSRYLKSERIFARHLPVLTLTSSLHGVSQTLNGCWRTPVSSVTAERSRRRSPMPACGSRLSRRRDLTDIYGSMWILNRCKTGLRVRRRFRPGRRFRNKYRSI